MRGDRLCGLLVRVPGYRTTCIMFPVRYELNLYMLCRKETASVVYWSEFLATERHVLCFL
jgi:hypothetical protein